MGTVNTKLVVIPQIYADIVREKISGASRVAQFATNLGSIVNKEVGETINFPVWKYIGDAKDIAVGTPMTAVELAQKNSTATIKMVAAPAVKVFDYDNVVAFGNALTEGASQQALSIARKIDSDLILEAQGTNFKQQLANKDAMTESELLDALGLFGDDRDTSKFAAIVIHSKLAKSFYLMDGFVKSTVTYVADANGKIVVNGVIGTYMGIPVVLTDKLYDTTNSEGYGFILKKGALGYMPKELPLVETERTANIRATTVYASQIYAVKMIDESGVVMFKNVVA